MSEYRKAGRDQRPALPTMSDSAPTGSETSVAGSLLEQVTVNPLFIPDPPPGGTDDLEWFLAWAMQDEPESVATVGLWAQKIERAFHSAPVRPVVPASEVNPERRRRYAHAALVSELNVLAAMPHEPCGRNQQLNDSAFKLARFVRDRILTRDEVVGPLRETALSIGLDAKGVDATLNSAFVGADAKGLTAAIPDREGYGDAYQIDEAGPRELQPQQIRPRGLGGKHHV